jgi:hypothetical protein
MNFLFRLLFGQSKSTSPLSQANSESIVVAYGAALEAHTPAPVVDIKALPYSKDEIKRAILAELGKISDPKLEKLREHLKAGYLMLAGFQDGVGETPPAFDFPKLDPSQINQALIKEMLPKLELIHKWNAIVENEQQILIGDLRELGHWKD